MLFGLWPSFLSYLVRKFSNYFLGFHYWRMMMMFRDKLNHCTVQQTKRHFRSVLFCNEKHSISCHCMPMYACQLWSKYIQNIMKRLRATYNKVYRIMHYIPRNVSVRPHKTSHCVRTLMPCWKTSCIDFLDAAHLHLTFLPDRFKCLMLFTKSSFFLNYSKLLYNGYQLQ